MAEIRFALGATADLVSGKEMDDKLTGLQGHLDTSLARHHAAGVATRRKLFGFATLTLTNGTNSVLTFSPASPAQGRVWCVTHFVVIGADDHTTATNLQAALYAGDDANFSQGDILLSGVTIPNFQTFNKDSLWVHDQEQLFVNFSATGAVTGQNVFIKASVNEYLDCDREYQVI